MSQFGLVDPTPEMHAEVKRLCEGWQDSSVLVSLHALCQANLAAALLKLGNGNNVVPEPGALRLDAADLRCAADGFAQFLEHLAEHLAERMQERELAEREPGEDIEVPVRFRRSAFDALTGQAGLPVDGALQLVKDGEVYNAVLWSGEIPDWPDPVPGNDAAASERAQR